LFHYSIPSQNLFFRNSGNTIDITFGDGYEQFWWITYLLAVIAGMMLVSEALLPHVDRWVEDRELILERKLVKSRRSQRILRDPTIYARVHHMGSACWDWVHELCVDLDSFFKITPGPKTVNAAGTIRIFMICFGISGALFFIAANLASPVSMAHWAWVNSEDKGGNYESIVVLICLTVSIFVCFSYQNTMWSFNWFMPTEGFQLRMRRLFCTILVPANILFVVMFVLTTQQQHPTPRTFFGPQKDNQLGQHITLYISLILSPVIYINLVLLFREIFIVSSTSPRLVVAGFSFANLVFMVLLMLLVFTVNPVGDLPVADTQWRDSYSVITFGFALCAFVPILFVRTNIVAAARFKTVVDPQTQEKMHVAAVDVLPKYYRRQRRSSALSSIIGTIILAIAVISIVSTQQDLENPNTFIAARTNGRIKVGNFNIHLGFDRDAEPALETMVDEIATMQADVLGLVESDTARYETGMIDSVQYVANELGYKYTYYGAQTGKGFFGVSILSRYKLHRTITYFVPGGDEDNVVVSAQVQVPAADGISAPVPYTFFFAHLNTNVDNGAAQMNSLVTFARNSSNVIISGDFNFDNNTSPDGYSIATNYFKESWTAVNPSGVDGAGYNGTTDKAAKERLDTFYVSPSLTVIDHTVINGPSCVARCRGKDVQADACKFCSASDHLPVAGTFQAP
jgi:endonuclease/exonuclease/phosphatase family metal-dependent hydrolase